MVCGTEVTSNSVSLHLQDPCCITVVLVNDIDRSCRRLEKFISYNSLKWIARSTIGFEMRGISCASVYFYVLLLDEVFLLWHDWWMICPIAMPLIFQCFDCFLPRVITIKKNRIPKKKPNTAKLKMLQALFNWACSWMELESASYRPSTGLGRIQHLNTKMVKFWIEKHPQMCSYGGYYGTFNVRQQCQTMKSGVPYGPQ
jgi:hypothetical protein